MLSLHRLTIFSHLCNHRHNTIRQIGTYLRLVPSQEAFELRFNATQLRWSGHNRWSKIGRKKMAADCVRATFVSKFVTKIKRSIRENGASPDHNIELRQLIEKGRELQIPKSTLDRSLTTKQGKIVTQHVGLRGESGFTLLVSLSGDLHSVNYSKSQIKKVARKYLLTILPAGTNSSLFVEKGIIEVQIPEPNEHDLEELAIEVGAEDYSVEKASEFENEFWQFKTDPQSSSSVAGILRSKDFVIIDRRSDYFPRAHFNLTVNQCEESQEVVEKLNEIEDTIGVYDNISCKELELEGPDLAY